MERASLVIGEVNDQVPRTMGNTFVHVDDFQYLVRATEPPIYFPRWIVARVDTIVVVMGGILSCTMTNARKYVKK